MFGIVPNNIVKENEIEIPQKLKETAKNKKLKSAKSGIIPLKEDTSKA